ncbi:Hypothetical protein PEIBARAKI_5878 [Petrimonas sp. IBARAKI]|jgi:hypothetical protein|nr:Hypothetical protein PEIBARAKI_5878 [Petrimonas sp. IBARAKI]
MCIVLFLKAELEDVVDALALAIINLFKHDIGTFDYDLDTNITAELWKSLN